MAGLTLPTTETSIYKIVQVVIGLVMGRSNAVGTITLRANQTTTTVTKMVDPAAVNVSKDSRINLIPRTANAANIAWAWWISSVEQESFTVTHVSNAATDLTFDWTAHG